MMAKDYDDEIDLEETGGFGKAAVAEAKKRPTYKSTEGQVDERDRREEAQANMAKLAAPKKAPIVTKEQMKKAGFDNLRDYLNAQRGLKRRDKPTSEGTKPAKAEPAKTEPAKPAAKVEKPGLFRRTVAALGGVKLPQSKYGSEPEDKRPTTRPKPYSTAAAIQAKNMGYKKGGMVSSASKRADGCAKRGKTKGRMV